MNNRAAVADFPGSLSTKWSLSKRDKRRLKQILALVATIIALLWLLYQLGQYTVALGADQPNRIHADGDRKITAHANHGFRHGSPAGGAGEGKRTARALPPPSAGVPGQASATDGAGSDQAVPAPFLDRDNQGDVPGTSGTDTQQQASAGPTSKDPFFFGYGNLPVPGITNGGAAGSADNFSNANSGGNGGGDSGGSGDGPSGHNPAKTTPDPGNNGGGSNPGNTPGDGPDIITNPDSPLFGHGGPDGGNGDPPGTPLTDPTTSSANATSPAPTVEVPEPASIALFGGGLLALLTALRCRRGSRHDRPQAYWKESAGLAMRRVVLGVASLAIIAGSASAETATIYGTTASIFSPNSGAFLPANTDLACFSMNEANCWDGKKWLHLYPSGRRRYAVAATDRVACGVIMAPSNDCWTGSVWYRLPKGQLFGVIGGFFSDTPGAFITAPLRSPAVTYTATSSQSPLGEFASKR
ncbi:MAG TPA: PEP-CTERM sorting domain-containing protein [Rhizomicrobium sp.]|jgi:hypothetical protein